jgi:hypothetical protein
LKTLLCHLLAILFWSNYVNFPTFYLLISNMEIIVPRSKRCFQIKMRSYVKYLIWCFYIGIQESIANENWDVFPSLILYSQIDPNSILKWVSVTNKQKSKITNTTYIPCFLLSSHDLPLKLSHPVDIHHTVMRRLITLFFYGTFLKFRDFVLFSWWHFFIVTSTKRSLIYLQSISNNKV